MFCFHRMKKFFSLLVFSLLFFPLFASVVSIKGLVVDAGDRSPLDFVNITLFKQGSEKPIILVSTDTKGGFTIPSIESGKYTVRLSYVGFTTVNQLVEVTGHPVNLGVIQMDPDTRKLGEVEVVGQSSQMHFDVDKKVYSVDQNITSAGGTASDVLKNIPSVTVDNQGNVSLRKDGNVEVWINGKASGLTVDNRAQVLQQLPAESIESVEIITNPSAKYNPEGSSGIINIVMKKTHKAGYYGSVSIGLITPDKWKLGINPGASFNYTSSKIDAYFNIGSRAITFDGGGTTDRKNFVGIDTTRLVQENKMYSSYYGLFLRAGMDYHLNKQNTIGFSGFGLAGNGKQNSTIHTVQSDLSTLLPTRDYNQKNTSSGTRPSLNLNLEYHHDFDKKGSNIIANASYSFLNRTGNNNYLQTETLTNAVSDITQITGSKNKEYEFKLDYINKLSENSKLEAGWQSKLSNRLSTASGFNNPTLYNMLPSQTEIPSYFDNFNYNEQIHAGYLTYGNRYNKLSFQMGLRAEYFNSASTITTKTSLDSVSIQRNPKKDIFHVFPSFYLSYSLPNNAELQFNYTNRVNRPSDYQLNPFKSFSDSTNISYGNPNLAPQYSSSLELNYIKTWDAQTLSASLYYHNTDSVIQNVRFLNGKTLESSFRNVGKSQNTGLELISKNRLFQILNLTSTFNMYYSKLDSASFVSPANQLIRIGGSSNLSWSANVMANFMLSKTFSGQITGEYDSPQVIPQGTQNAKFSLDLGVRKTFMQNKLTVSMNIRDLLNSNSDNQTTSGAGFSQTTSMYFHGRMVGVNIGYNFGNTKPSDMKKKDASSDMNMLN